MRGNNNCCAFKEGAMLLLLYKNGIALRLLTQKSGLKKQRIKKAGSSRLSLLKLSSTVNHYTTLVHLILLFAAHLLQQPHVSAVIFTLQH
jgi:hypothetical protein